MHEPLGELQLNHRDDENDQKQNHGVAAGATHAQVVKRLGVDVNRIKAQGVARLADLVRGLGEKQCRREHLE